MANTREELSESVRNFVEEFHQSKMKLLNEVNEYAEANPTETSYPFNNELNALDDLALFRAWVEDRLDKVDSYTSWSTYNKSRSRKIRKALWFTF